MVTIYDVFQRLHGGMLEALWFKMNQGFTFSQENNELFLYTFR